MTLMRMLADLDDVPESLFEEAIFDSFKAWVTDSGISMYPAQEEAVLGILTGDNVILSTPTGSGKSLVAIGAHFMALAKGQRTFYTAPIKALVSEKFFSLADIFGPENVGMMTGDATVNGDAPIICATAEIVANIALREGVESRIDQVIMDEFHYYSDPQRGWAWQVPLLELPKAQFLLMSATLGNTSFLEKDLSQRTGRKTTLVSGAERPVPLNFSYVYTPVHETVENLLKAGEYPICIVHPSQREASERAQSMTSLNLVNAAEREKIVAEIGDFRFSTTFGRQLSNLLRRGIGVHHAGMLPKYRRLVEKLSQTGLLKVISSTDTLGVGINIPIRTVLITSLSKFDGTKQRILKSREFHQVAGRAGRAGFDTHGNVVVQAPEHEVENVRAREKAGSDPKKLKKIRKKQARDGQIIWSLRTFERLVESQPEPLTSQFRVSNAMVMNLLARSGPNLPHFQNLLRTNHDPRAKQNSDILTTIELLRGLINAEIVEELPQGQTDSAGRSLHLTLDMQPNFALNQPLAPLAVAALDLLDPDSNTYDLDVISTFEAILDDPRPLLIAQQRARRDEEMAALKAEGVDYSTRMTLLEEVTWPKPLATELENAYATYVAGAPWAREFELRPKSVLREMIEKAMTFSDLIATYGLARSEGVLLRYLTDIWRTLLNTLPHEYLTEELEDIIEWLGEMIRQVDSSLVDEWAIMTGDTSPISKEVIAQELAFGVSNPDALTANLKAFTRMVRNAMFRIITLFAREQEEQLEEIFDYLAEIPDFGAAMDEYFAEYDDLDFGPEARGGEYFRLNQDSLRSRNWKVRQILHDPENDNAFSFVATIDLDQSDEHGEVRFYDLKFESN
ncbi:DEAD/DEAH box helicase [Corynebacterium caspium]|uniref:DEAD/DEAH box helicase n=1 Tax=Corynebacterium caspium TaxID=234828 RepID=UPI000361EB74|nr:DEAD/DEAH box helicase [Corynebacterium caspium]WKD59135.1 ski2-like helicase [Corynebacterium caspium DSM 44850]